MVVHRKKDRAMGAFIGLAVGDALGTTVEFKARDSFPPVTEMVGGGPFNLKPGQWTDDTSMALCLADTLIAGKGQLDKKVLLEKFLRWWKYGENSCTGECFDIGNTTRKALDWYDRTGTVENNPLEADSGNGSLMRLAPAAVCGKDRWITARLATQQSMTTHASQTVLRVCGQTALLLADLIDGRKIKPEDWGDQYGIVGWDRLLSRDALRDREHWLCRRYVHGRSMVGDQDQQFQGRSPARCQSWRRRRHGGGRHRPDRRRLVRAERDPGRLA